MASSNSRVLVLDQLGDLDVAVCDLTAHIVPRELEPDPVVVDVDIWMVVLLFEVRRQSADEAQ
jgi:hypothetical protein